MTFKTTFLEEYWTIWTKWSGNYGCEKGESVITKSNGRVLAVRGESLWLFEYNVCSGDAIVGGLGAS